MLVIGVTTVVSSYSRAFVALHDAPVAAAFLGAARCFRSMPKSVATHLVTFLLIWGAGAAVIAVLDVALTPRDGWWYVLIAQLYVTARLMSRVLWEVSVLELVREHSERRA
jgi:hypothetical protein